MNWEDIYKTACRIVNFLITEKTSDVNEKVDFIDPEESVFIEKIKDSDYLYKNILQREEFDYRHAYLKFCRHIRLKRAVKYLIPAISAGIVIGMFLLSDNKSDNKIISEDLTNNIEIKEYPEIKPGVKKATLVLADGRKMNLGEADSLIVEDNGVLINVDSAGIKYDESKISAKKNELIYNTLEIPRGGEFFTTLADGTKVWLNADSKLKYPVSFYGDKRMVYLEGEAYFEVAKDSVKQFIVRTNAGDVIVHGTEFNVKEYSEDLCLFTTLVKGSVEFKERWTQNGTNLLPGTQLSYNLQTGSLDLRKVNVYNYISWKDKLFQFEEQTLEEIMKTLSRWYDVTVSYESDALRNILFSGSLDKYENIGSFLTLFEAGGKIEFIVENKNILVKRKI